MGPAGLRRVARFGGPCGVGIVGSVPGAVTVASLPAARGVGLVGGGSVGRRTTIDALRCARRGVLAAGLVALAF